MRTDYASIAPGEEVVLRGFLYKKENGEWILADEPSLKTCCVGADHTADRQVILEGKFQEAYLHRAVTLKGIWNKQIDSYHLMKAEFVEHTSSFTFLKEELIGQSSLIAWVFLGVMLSVVLWKLRDRFLQLKSPPLEP